jgi:hypothetical protein
MNALGTAVSAYSAKDKNIRFVNGDPTDPNALMYTGFNSFEHEETYDWEQPIGQYGRPNNFYGVPSEIPLPQRRAPGRTGSRTSGGRR